MFIRRRDQKSILTASIYLTERTDEIKRELYENCIYLGGRGKDIRATATEEILAFLAEVKNNRREQLAASGRKIDLIYYLWFDDQAGQLRFNFINSNHPRLSFCCEYREVVTEAEIVELFRHGSTLDGIPWSEFVEVDPEDDEEEEEFVRPPLPVFREVLSAKGR